MSPLLFYCEEKVLFPKAYETKFGVAEANIVAHKIARHYKIPLREVYWTSGSRKPRCHGQYAITLNRDYNTAGTLCHELAHAFEFKKTGTSRHGNKLMRIIKRFIVYGEKHAWWHDEILKRLAPKPAKPEPTKEELRALRVEKVRVKIQHYEKKVKMYEHKLSRAQKSLTMLQKRSL